MPLVPAVFVGVLAAVGGVDPARRVLGLPVAIMHVGSLYAVAATAGTMLLVVLVAFGVNLVVAAIVCVIVTTLIRLARCASTGACPSSAPRQLEGLAPRLSVAGPDPATKRRLPANDGVDQASSAATGACGSRG